MENKILIQKAIEIKNNAYAPYSHFKVGAAVLTDKGNIYTGINVENASYPVGSCAEQTAVANAVINKEKIIKIAIFGDKDYTYPCGKCRQILVEFNPDMDVIIGKDEKEYKVIKAKELLPNYFS